MFVRKRIWILIAVGIGHAHVKVFKIRFPMQGQDFSERINVETGCYFIADGADYHEVGYVKRRACHDFAKHLVVYVLLRYSTNCLSENSV